MPDNRVLREIAAPEEVGFRDALIMGLSRVAAALGRGTLADRSRRSTRSLDMLFSGEIGLPSGKGLMDFLLADATALDEVLALYGIRVSARVSDAGSDMSIIAELAGVLARFTDALADGRRDHRETIALADLLRPLIPKLTALVSEADAHRRQTA